ncbi:hypothetical protein [Microbacterium sp. NPDC089695]|uniref:hypothetical protein n=1 Tax=Microbacterium sp. NPDC089695 TaxID=3364198 RepID=UPI00382ADE37
MSLLGEDLLKKARAERMRRLGGSSVFLGICPSVFLLVSSSSAPAVATLVAVGTLALCLWLWIRVAVTGVRATADQFNVTSWWRRRVYSRRAAARFRAEPYYGWFFVLGWTVNAGRAQSGELVMEMRSGRRVRLGGTVCNLRTARRIAENLNQWLGIEEGSGTGPRRSLRGE